MTSAAWSPTRPENLPAAVLWDMDGTLIDSEPYWIAEEHALVESFGGTWSDELAHQLVGNALATSADFIIANSPVDLDPLTLIHRLQGGVIRRIQEEVPWRPGARELLAELRAAGVLCALVTMSWVDLADAVVACLPDESFDVVITGDVVERGKPHPEPYTTAARLLGVNVHECVAIEDSTAGMRSAHAAGAMTIVVPHVVDVDAPDGVRRLTSLAGVRPGDLLGIFA